MSSPTAPATDLQVTSSAEGMLFKSLLCLLALWVVSPVTAQAADAASRDARLEALVASIQKVEEGEGIGPAAQELAKKLQAYQGAAIPYLLPLLESKQAKVRNFAGYVMSNQDGLTEEHLEALIAAQQRGNGWVPRAIGRIGTPRAIKFLVDGLKTNPDYGSNTQVAIAIETAGERAIPDLVALLKDPAPLSPDLSWTLCRIFSAMETKAGTAVDLLLEIARDKKFDLKNRLYAVKEAGCIRPAARVAIPALQALVSSDPEGFASAVDEAVINMGVPESVPMLVAKLRSKPHILAMRDIAALRDNGRDAGPALAEFLSSGDADLRVGAARALGFIGYGEAADALIPLLKEPDDWRLVYVAVESLGRLHAPSAIPKLEKLAMHHWYPPVVDAARKAVKVIRGEEVYESKPNHEHFPFEFFAYDYVRADDVTLPGQQIEPTLVRGPDELTNEKLRKLAYVSTIAGHDRDGKKTARFKTLPVCGLKTSNGFILGSDQGEWGGELVYRSKKGSVVTLLRKNTMGVHRLPFGILAVTGLAHLASNYGALYLITPHEDGTFKASRWKTLPGAPRMSGMLSNGNLFISAWGGNVVITPGGQIEMADKFNTTRLTNR